jgi:tRNA dimethylallyltransferase
MKVMKKLLFIVGQTATGKTATALQLAEALDGDILSADSRQVYIGLDIGTGKDIPNTFVPVDTELQLRGKPIRTLTNGRTKLWLVDQIYPDEEWSVAHFAEAAWTIIPQLWKNKRLPIIVGGTGFYIQSILQPAQTIGVPRQDALRQELDELSVEELQRRAEIVSPERYAQLNNSDRNNPRRLTRMIEIAETAKTEPQPRPKNVDSLFIGLTADEQLLESRIRSRVESRVQAGMIEEVAALRKKYGAAITTLPAFSATGYAETVAYLDKKITLDELIALWTQRELDYAKRQNVWFKKQFGIQWFNIRDAAEKTRLDIAVKTWYHKSHGATSH